MPPGIYQAAVAQLRTFLDSRYVQRMIMKLVSVALSLQFAPGIAGHEHTSGRLPIQTTQGAGATCGKIGTLRIETAWSPAGGIKLKSVTLNGRALRATDEKALNRAIRQLWIASNVEVGCISNTTFTVGLSGLRRGRPSGHGSVSALITDGKVRLVP